MTTRSCRVSSRTGCLNRTPSASLRDPWGIHTSWSPVTQAAGDAVADKPLPALRAQERQQHPAEGEHILSCWLLAPTRTRRRTGKVGGQRKGSRAGRSPSTLAWGATPRPRGLQRAPLSTSRRLTTGRRGQTPSCQAEENCRGRNCHNASVGTSQEKPSASGHQAKLTVFTNHLLLRDLASGPG